jgi:hypothetical protein
MVIGWGWTDRAGAITWFAEIGGAAAAAPRSL